MDNVFLKGRKIGRHQVDLFIFRFEYIVYINNRKYNGVWEDAIKEVFEAIQQKRDIKYG